MLTLSDLKYLVIFLLSIQNALGEPRWYDAADGNKYLVDERWRYTWYDALVECSSRNLSMVSVTSEEKNKALIDVLKKTSSVFYWIGASGTNTYGALTFSWVATGEPLDYSFWLSGEPNGNGKENCVLIDRIDYKWNDNDCLWKWSLVCEENPLLAQYKQQVNVLANGVYGNNIFNSRLQSDLSAIKGILSDLNSDAQSVQQQNEALLG